MKKLLNDYKFPLLSFLCWRSVLFLFLYLAITFVPPQNNFLGGGKENYLAKPYFWSWVNFDGEHYLSISQNGYKSLQHFYFPLYPMAVGLISNVLPSSLMNIALIGLVVSNLAFLFSLVGLWKLIKLEYDENIAKLTLILILVFPTSFYFAAFYTESLFLMLSVWSLYLIRKQKYLLAGILGGLLSATRIVGLALLPCLLFRFLKERDYRYVITLLLLPVGLISYMFYLYEETGDPFTFVNTISIFGNQRSANFILLPQVFYRYIFKIIPNLSWSYFPQVFTTLMEFSVALLFFVLIILSFKKIKLEYIIFSIITYLIPTFSGSFSSMPRYILACFPLFIVAALHLKRTPRLIRSVILTLLVVLQAVSLSLFTRGYWLS